MKSIDNSTRLLLYLNIYLDFGKTRFYREFRFFDPVLCTCNLWRENTKSSIIHLYVVVVVFR